MEKSGGSKIIEIFNAEKIQERLKVAVVSSVSSHFSRTNRISARPSSSVDRVTVGATPSYSTARREVVWAGICCSCRCDNLLPLEACDWTIAVATTVGMIGPGIEK